MMTEGFDNLEDVERIDKEDIYSKVVRAGKRTYFFDVKATRRNDFYLTITESKKRIGREGKFFFEKHKIFLYKEDFEKFADGLNDVVAYIRSHQTEIIDENQEMVVEEIGVTQNEFTNIEFDDLEK
ncbi:MAG: DUF3276 family protein [Tenuifilaceae bacterium]